MFMGQVTLEKKGRTAVITLNRPEKQNALTAGARQELYTILKKIDADTRIRAAVISGAGDAFAAGADIQAMKAYSIEDAVQSSRQGSNIFLFLEQMPIPVIAAINGWALGGGLELALACDIRICSANAKFGQPEVKVGILPGYGANIRLPRTIGISRAKEMIYFGKIITAAEAETIGLVTRVIPREQLMQTALDMAAQLARGPASISLAKQAINSVMDLDMDRALAVSSRLYGDAYKTQDAREGIQAYLEKRPPVFQGN
jgi:enoyl-CoA hydratase